MWFCGWGRGSGSGSWWKGVFYGRVEFGGVEYGGSRGVGWEVRVGGVVEREWEVGIGVGYDGGFNSFGDEFVSCVCGCDGEEFVGLGELMGRWSVSVRRCGW